MLKEIESKVRTKIQELRVQHTGALNTESSTAWKKEFKEEEE